MSDKKSEVERLKAEMRALADTRKARLAAQADAAERATLQRQLENNRAIADAEEKLGEQGVHIACVMTPDDRVVILKRAPYALFREYQEKKDAKTSELEELVEACRHYPDSETFDKIVEEFPGLLNGLVKGVLKLAGSLQEDAAKIETLRKEARDDRNFAATLLLETIGQTPADERALARQTAGATLIVDAFADLRIIRQGLTQKA